MAMSAPSSHPAASQPRLLLPPAQGDRAPAHPARVRVAWLVAIFLALAGTIVILFVG